MLIDSNAICQLFLKTIYHDHNINKKTLQAASKNAWKKIQLERKSSCTQINFKGATKLL